MYFDSLIRYGSCWAACGRHKLTSGFMSNQTCRHFATRSIHTPDETGINYDNASVSPFILQAQKHIPEYERIINMSTRILSLTASELESEKSRIERKFAETSSCASCESFVNSFIHNFRERILSQVFTDNPNINKVTSFVLQAHSKLFRPRLGFMVARVLSVYGHTAGSPGYSDNASERDPYTSMYSEYAKEEVLDRVMRLLQSYEIVHAGSLIHDDIFDDAETRRNQQAAHIKMGTKISVLVGDVMLTRACATVANLGSQQSTVRMAKALENLIKGELMEVKASPNIDVMLKVYLQKIFLKTASLIAECCASVADLFYFDPTICHKSYLIGLHVGMAFQIYDDLLDYRGKSSQLGKPAMKDLASDLITLPLIFALPESRDLGTLIESGATLSENMEHIISHVHDSRSFERTQLAVMLHLYEVSQLLRSLNTPDGSISSPLSPTSQSLLRFVYDTLTRTKD
ncbi:polyprenyl synthetase superfamily protein [Babesia divergens]|uniref:Polyprenyl synthetase superfamily protein n=1 Tax=Babesia divergens TaxID=32595 RepID=A0AAD9GKJ3_BABDI|nr:polyprenyl synthetase superfamily protein [Babesia divergens]